MSRITRHSRRNEDEELNQPRGSPVAVAERVNPRQDTDGLSIRFEDCEGQLFFTQAVCSRHKVGAVQPFASPLRRLFAILMRDSCSERHPPNKGGSSGTTSSASFKLPRTRRLKSRSVNKSSAGGLSATISFRIQLHAPTTLSISIPRYSFEGGSFNFPCKCLRTSSSESVLPSIAVVAKTPFARWTDADPSRYRVEEELALYARISTELLRAASRILGQPGLGQPGS